MQAHSQSLKREGKTIGFVPTMGYLHEGHLSLIRLAKEKADVVVVSIFVNPTQFGPNEDLDNYPRDFKRDESLCKEEGVDVIFYPTPDEMYLQDHSVNIDETFLSKSLCGASRPGHFSGVVTIVAKLFNVVLPDMAVFGEKDAQQLRIIKRMVRDLNFPVEIISGPIVREPNGLAMSSRNAYLPVEARPHALCLKQALDDASNEFRLGERNVETLKQCMRAIIKNTPSTSIDYIEIVDNETLEPLSVISGSALVALAVNVGNTRLIDNVVLC